MDSVLLEVLEDEIYFVSSWMEYPNEPILPLESLADAKVQIDGMKLADDFPDRLWDPALFLFVWNYCAGRENARNRLEE